MRRSLIVLFVCLVFIPLVSFAQEEPWLNKHSVGLLLEMNAPVDNFSEATGIGYGFNARYQFVVETQAVLMATAGYLAWVEKGPGQNVEPKAFNLFIGGKYYLASGYYASLEGGVYFLTHNYYSGTVLDYTNRKTRFFFPMGVGFQQNGIEIGARYMLGDTDFNCMSFTLGYNFSL